MKTSRTSHPGMSKGSRCATSRGGGRSRAESRPARISECRASIRLHHEVIPMSIRGQCRATEPRRGQPAAQACRARPARVWGRLRPRVGQRTRGPALWRVHLGCARRAVRLFHHDGRAARRASDHARPLGDCAACAVPDCLLPLRLVARGMEASAGPFGRRLLEPKSTRRRRAASGWSLPSASTHGTASVFSGEVNDIGVGPAITSVGFPTADARLRLTGSLVRQRPPQCALPRSRSASRNSVELRSARRLRLRTESALLRDRQQHAGDGTLLLPARGINAEASLLLAASPHATAANRRRFSSMSPDRGYNGQPLLEYVFGRPACPSRTRIRRSSCTASPRILPRSTTYATLARPPRSLRRAACLRAAIQRSRLLPVAGGRSRVRSGVREAPRDCRAWRLRRCRSPAATNSPRPCLPLSPRAESMAIPLRGLSFRRFRDQQPSAVTRGIEATGGRFSTAERSCAAMS